MIEIVSVFISLIALFAAINILDRYFRYHMAAIHNRFETLEANLRGAFFSLNDRLDAAEKARADGEVK
ncbi:hypothetical protein FF100_22145 [Methylobacterium terricola]|uniref:Uncharacterized protein n=1 Tax=Methylobacterium terricola TaxID=2583531 RepID=A0A5C4LF68_9HYPH|nr:hypothetical protein [Methylobacterium terricola]TNC10855.1 hypothetical protein FF100_22145 [Methylobacterium terricola]